MVNAHETEILIKQWSQLKKFIDFDCISHSQPTTVTEVKTEPQMYWTNCMY